MNVYALMTDNYAPNSSDGAVVSLYKDLSAAKEALHLAYELEIVAYGEGCELEEGEDYMYDKEAMIVSDFDQWWWVKTLEVS